MKIFYFFLIVTIVSACGSTNNKPVEMSESSPKTLDSTIDKEKFDTRWVDDITEMADTDDWIILKDDDHFTLIQVLKSRTNRHYILYSKNAGFDINGLAYMKIQSPSCLDIHVYKCNIDKLNFSIKDAYSTDFAFKKLNTFLNDELLKFRSSTKIKKSNSESDRAS